MVDPSSNASAEPMPGRHGWRHWAHTLKAQVLRVQWHWVLLAGVGAPLITAMVANLASIGLTALVFSAVKVSMDEHVQITHTVIAITDLGSPLLNALLTSGLAAWTTRRVGRDAVRHGLLIGATSMLVGVGLGSLLGLRFSLDGAVQERWNAAMMLLTAVGGCLGGLEARAALNRQEALYRASRAIVAASSPQAVVTAIGEHLAGPGVSQVSFWRVDSQAEDGAPAGIALLAAWTPQGGAVPPSEWLLDASQFPALARLRQQAPLRLHVRDVPASDERTSERTVWERLGARSLLLLPLTTSDNAWVGVLMVASQTVRRFRRDVWQAEIISGQVALALENLRLVDQARQAAVLEERQRLAREIHDTLTQGFTSIVMHLEAAEQSLPDEPATVQRHLDQARDTAREGLAQARRLVWALRPEILEGLSLSEALERAVARWVQESGIEASTITTGAVYSLPAEVEVTLLRAAQEALSNVRKHAQASQVAVTLSYMGDMVVLDVQDDGSGFDPVRTPAPTTPTAGGFGLTAMRERVEQLGGTLLVESVPGQGTTLVVEILTPANGQVAEMGSEIQGKQGEGWSTSA